MREESNGSKEDEAYLAMKTRFLPRKEDEDNIYLTSRPDEGSVLSECEIEETESADNSEVQMFGNVFVVIDGCLAYSKDKISMGKGHVAHFISVDCNLNSPISQELLKYKMIVENNSKAQEFSFVRRLCLT